MLTCLGIILLAENASEYRLVSAEEKCKTDAGKELANARTVHLQACTADHLVQAFRIDFPKLPPRSVFLSKFTDLHLVRIIGELPMPPIFSHFQLELHFIVRYQFRGPILLERPGMEIISPKQSKFHQI